MLNLNLTRTLMTPQVFGAQLINPTTRHRPKIVRKREPSSSQLATNASTPIRQQQHKGQKARVPGSTAILAMHEEEADGQNADMAEGVAAMLLKVSLEVAEAHEGAWSEAGVVDKVEEVDVVEHPRLALPAPRVTMQDHL